MSLSLISAADSEGLLCVFNAGSAVYSTSYGDMTVTIKSEPLDPGDLEFADASNYEDDNEMDIKVDVVPDVANSYVRSKRGRKKGSKKVCIVDCN